MARKKAAYRKRQQNKFSMLLVTMVLVMIMVVVSISGRKLREKIDAVSETQTRYERLLQEEEKRKQDIEEFGKYTQTKKYVEEVAQDKLGLVYEGDIIFKQEQ
ncbi:MAG: septum formation initiator family protein [Acetatifactor sp.]|nr:septum formation initiator family protein [Acetatifactor sp.]